MLFYLPENLDLENLMHYNRPRFKPFKSDKLRYIIHTLNARRLYDKDLMYEDFIPLNAVILQKKIQNYKQYLDYLIHDLKIVETDGSYKVGSKSRGYRLINKYQAKTKPVNVLDQTFYRTLKREKNKKELSVKHLDYLNKWFNPKLQIDLDLIKNYLQEEYNLKKDNYKLWDYDRIKKKHKKPINQYNHSLISSSKLYNKDYNYMLDPNVYRYHTNLTNMRSILRNAVTYDGQKLISIDIKNSQPYLSTILLNRFFWIEEKKSPKNKAYLSINFDKPTEKRDPNFVFTSFSNINNSIININKIKIHKEDTYIMLGEMDISLENKDFTKYVDLVVRGKLYEFLQEVFAKELGLKLISRKEVKVAVFQVLFTDNRFIGQKDARPKKIFKEYFPEEYAIFAKIKKKDKSLLPRLLQSIESYLMIDIIAKRIAKEFPNAPIYTIHDSISTTAQYVDDVQRIMTEELTKAIGYPPSLSREEWDVFNIHKSLNDLKIKALETGVRHISLGDKKQSKEQSESIA